MRAGEMFGLKWDHIQPFGDGMVAVVDGKNGQERAVVCNSLATLAVERQSGGEYVFPSQSGRNRGGRITSWNKVFGNAWEAARLPCGPLDKRGIHNLRHTFGYRLRRAGVPEEDRRKLLGHENANLMDHYAEPDLERLLAHAEKVTERPKDGKEFMLRSLRAVS
jgi:integrase